MPYTSNIGRGTAPSYTAGANGSQSLIPEDVASEIIKGATEKSAALSMFKHRRMITSQQRMPVLATKPSAYFVSGDTGLKQTTNMSWKNKFLDAEEIAVIVPIPEKVLDDVRDGGGYDLWAEIKPELEEAIAVTLDEAIFFGINKPSSWPTALGERAITVGNVVIQGTGVDLADDLNSVMAAVEADGFDVNGFWIKNTLKASLRGLRTADREFVFQGPERGLVDTVFKGAIFGEKAVTSKSGVFEDAATLAAGNTAKIVAIAGDWNQGVIGIRQDLTWKMLDQASLYDASGNVTYALAQQDMVAMRVVARYAWQVPNPINRMNTAEGSSPTSGDRFPFAVLRTS
jgi:HK97 family phage major capsid protein